MTIAVDLGRKATKNQINIFKLKIFSLTKPVLQATNFLILEHLLYCHLSIVIGNGSY